MRPNAGFHGLNQWPDNLPGFRETVLEYMSTLETLCRRLVSLYALALGLPAEFFDKYFAEPHMILRMSRYPVIDGEDEKVASLVPHTNSGFMTLLPPNPVSGLSILLPTGRWIDAPGITGAYVVNGGDILHRWTNERFPSTPHRVRNVSGQLRYAIPFFCDPRHDTIIECLPSCRSAEQPAEITADPLRRLRVVVRPQDLRAHGERAGPAGRCNRARRPRDGALVTAISGLRGLLAAQSRRLARGERRSRTVQGRHSK